MQPSRAIVWAERLRRHQPTGHAALQPAWEGGDTGITDSVPNCIVWFNDMVSCRAFTRSSALDQRTAGWAER